MSLAKSPLISKDLVDYLQQVFPNVLPEQPTELGQLGILIGQQKVVAHLLFQFKVQNRPRAVPD